MRRWDLEVLRRLYAEFEAAYRPMLAQRSHSPETAFTTYVPMLTAWRRLPYLDPGLPLAHLPQDWIGVAAGHLFEQLDHRLRGLEEANTAQAAAPQEERRYGDGRSVRGVAARGSPCDAGSGPD